MSRGSDIHVGVRRPSVATEAVAAIAVHVAGMSGGSVRSSRTLTRHADVARKRERPTDRAAARYARFSCMGRDAAVSTNYRTQPSPPNTTCQNRAGEGRPQDRLALEPGLRRRVRPSEAGCAERSPRPRRAAATATSRPFLPRWTGAGGPVWTVHIVSEPGRGPRGAAALAATRGSGAAARRAQLHRARARPRRKRRERSERGGRGAGRGRGRAALLARPATTDLVRRGGRALSGYSPVISVPRSTHR